MELYTVTASAEGNPDYTATIPADDEWKARTRIMAEYPYPLAGQLVEYEVAIANVLEYGESCPECGAYWGNPTLGKDFPNRPKINYNGHWWWKCYNPECKVGFYTLEGQVEHEV